MLDEATLEQRLTTLEQAVFNLQNKFDKSPSSDNWLEKLIGSVSDDAAFLEALEYGRAFRHSDKPIDDVDNAEYITVTPTAPPPAFQHSNKPIDATGG